MITNTATKTLDMRFIRYLNLFEKITKLRIKDCFFYNNAMIFVVPTVFVSKAIGEGGKNVKKLSQILGKRVKIVTLPHDINDAEKFISDIINPVKFKSLEIADNEIIINAGRESKAALIGRNKIRLKEMKMIVKQYFGKELRII